MTPHFPSAFSDDDVIGPMGECHTRIRTFCGGLALLDSLDDLGDPRAPDAATRCARYFRVGLPLHGQDEDESLAPRLRAVGVAPRVTEALDRIRADHLRMDRTLPALLDHLDGIAAGKPPDHAAFHEVVVDFTTLLLDHIALEEAVIYPACKALPAAARVQIRHEMRERRA
jgi:hemerythrin-like domain-containing protein